MFSHWQFKPEEWKLADAEILRLYLSSPVPIGLHDRKWKQGEENLAYARQYGNDDTMNQITGMVWAMYRRFGATMAQIAERENCTLRHVRDLVKIFHTPEIRPLLTAEQQLELGDGYSGRTPDPLTPLDKLIYAEYQMGELGQRALAAKHGVSRQQVRTAIEKMSRLDNPNA